MRLLNSRNQEPIELYGSNLYNMVVECRNNIFDMKQPLSNRIFVVPDVVFDLNEDERIMWQTLQYRQALEKTKQGQYSLTMLLAYNAFEKCYGVIDTMKLYHPNVKVGLEVNADDGGNVQEADHQLKLTGEK